MNLKHDTKFYCINSEFWIYIKYILHVLFCCCSFRVVIDTSERGDLENCNILGPYSETHQYAMLTSSGMM